MKRILTDAKKNGIRFPYAGLCGTRVTRSYAENENETILKAHSNYLLSSEWFDITCIEMDLVPYIEMLCDSKLASLPHVLACVFRQDKCFLFCS